MNPQVFAERTPEKPATIMASTGETMSYRVLDQTARKVAALLAGLGLKRGDHIAMLVANEIMYHPLAWGAWFAGLYFTPISTRLTSDEIGRVIDNSGSKVVVASREFEDVVCGLRADRAGVDHWYLTARGNGRLPGVVEAIEWFSTLEVEANAVVGADMLYSSGATGEPKETKPALGALRDDPDSFADLLAKLYNLDATSRYLTPAPLYHGSLTKFSMALHRVGGTNVIMETFDAERALAAIDRYRVSHSQWTPTLFHRLISLAPDVRGRFDLSSHRVAVYADAPCPVELKRQITEWWGPIIHEFHAGSEAIGFEALA